MTYEAELRARYKEIHSRLFKVPPKIVPPKIIPPVPIVIAEIRPREPADNPPPWPAKVTTIARWVAWAEDIGYARLISRDRSRPALWGRFVTYYLAYRYTGATMPLIGRAMGGRDHTTVLHGIRMCGKWKASNVLFAARLEKYELVLSGLKNDVDSGYYCADCPHRKP